MYVSIEKPRLVPKKGGVELIDVGKEINSSMTLSVLNIIVVPS